MKYICAILFFLSFVCVNYTTAQNTYGKDTTPVVSIIKKAKLHVQQQNFDSAKQLFTAAIAVSKENHYAKGEGYAHLHLAEIAIELKEVENVQPHANRALYIGKQINDSTLLGLTNFKLGKYYLKNQQYAAAMQYYQSALKIYYQKHSSINAAIAYNDIGFLHGFNGQLALEVENYLKAIRIYEKIGDPLGHAQTLNNMAVVMQHLGNKEAALKYAFQAIEIRKKNDDIVGLSITYSNIAEIYLNNKDLPKAIEFQQIAMRYALQSENKKRIAIGYYSMALILNNQRKNHEALEYEKKAIDILEEIEDQITLSRRYISAAILSKATGDSSAALRYFDNAFGLSSTLNLKANLRDIYLHKAIFYKDHKDFYNAYENYKKYIVYRDSILSDKVQSEIAEISAKYETEKKDNEIERLSIEQKVKVLEIEKQKAIINGNELLAKQKQTEINLLSQEKQLQAVKIAQQDKEILNHALLAKNKEQELKLAQQEKSLQSTILKQQRNVRNLILLALVFSIGMGAILFNRFKLKKKLEQQEKLIEVRSHIARDLHDEIGSTLTSIKILSDVSKLNLHKDLPKTNQFLEKISNQSAQMQQGMSDIIWTIQPDNDRLENLLVRMREYAAHTLEPLNTEVIFDIDETAQSEVLTMQQRRDFFLIFKEAINNAAKYAQATTVKVILRKLNKQLNLIIIDDGKGFDPAAQRSSNGLKNMKSRAEKLAGKFSVTSSPNNGTRISLEIPST